MERAKADGEAMHAPKPFSTFRLVRQREDSHASYLWENLPLQHVVLLLQHRQLIQTLAERGLRSDTAPIVGSV